jgi:importin-7
MLQSPVGVVRARACWVMEHFSDMKWKTNRTLENIVTGLLQGLRDPCLPVQAAAACSLRLQISSDVAKEMIRPILYGKT